MYDVGPYTIAPIKVVWRRMDRRINAAVAEPRRRSLTGPSAGDSARDLLADCEPRRATRPIICARCLNSALTNFIICSHAVRGGKGFGTPGMLDYLRLRQFQPDDRRHRHLADLSRQAHAAAARGESRRATIAIDQAAADLDGLSPAQLAAICACRWLDGSRSLSGALQAEGFPWIQNVAVRRRKWREDSRI